MGVEVSERVVQVLKSPETTKVIVRIFEEKNLTAPGEIEFDENDVIVEEIIIPVIVDPWAWMDPRFKRVSQNIGGGNIGLGFGICWMWLDNWFIIPILHIQNWKA